MTDDERRAADAEAAAWSGPWPDPDTFFEKRDGLLVATLAREVLERLDVARMELHGDSDAHDPLWTYRGGVWVPGGEKAVEQMVVRLLGERHRGAHAKNVIDVIRTMDVPVLTPDAPHPDLLNVANGMLDWRSGLLAAHDPGFLSTVQVPVRWDRSATAPTVDAWLAEVLPEPGMVPFAWEVLGYLLLNGNPLHRAFLLVGAGRNGKSTFLRIVEALLGRGNCSSVPLQKLGNGHRFASAEMFLKSANVCGDLASTHLEDTSTFKQVTGGDPVFAERKGRDPFQFIWWGVPIFSANQMPGATDTSHGFLARWEVVRFPVDLSDRVDPTIESRLLSELPGVLVRAVTGLRAVMDRGGFDRPDAVVGARDAFARHVDQVRGFLTDCTRPGGFTERQELFRSYLKWSTDNGTGELKARNFYERLRSAGVQDRKTGGVRGFAVTLGAARADDDPPDGADGADGPIPPHAHGGKVGKPALSAPSAPDDCPF